jgi:hypothetical protein
MKPFKLRKPRPGKSQEKKGGAALTPGASAGSAKIAIGGGEAVNVAALGTAAPGAGSSLGLWSSYVSAIGQSTGLSAAAATKTGIAALVLTATSGVVVISLLVGHSTPTSRPQHGGLVFSNSTPNEPAAKSLAKTNNAPAAVQTSGLEYLQGQRDGSIGEIPDRAEQVAVANAPAPTTTKKVPVVPHKPAKVAKAKKPTAKKKMRKSRRLASRSSTLQSKVTLQAPKDLAGGSGFQDIYKNPNGPADAFRVTKRPNMGASRRTAALSSGGSATSQAKFANRMSRSGMRAGRANAASTYASQAFDGSNSLGRTGQVPGGGGGVLGGTGLGTGASSIKDSKTIDTPPPPEDVKKKSNQTPYQGLIYAGMGALLIGMMLLKMAGQLISQGRSAGPQGAAMIAQGKALAVAAMGAGGAAAGIGAMLMGEYDQMAQGLPFIIGGGALAVQAGMVLAKADQAGEEAQGESDTAFLDAGTQAGQMLGQMAGQQGNKVDSDLDANTEKAKTPQGRTYNSGGADAARGGSG